jgi:phosphoheptose isomerase
VGELETVLVKILATGQGPVRINADDFREDLHERWEHMRAGASSESLQTSAPAEGAPTAPAPAKPPKRKG